jgi:hypothetical protein
MCIILMCYEKLIYDHLIENITQCIKWQIQLLEEKQSLLFVKLIHMMKLLLTVY